jgi:hypothetical protein
MAPIGSGLITIPTADGEQIADCLSWSLLFERDYAALD